MSSAFLISVSPLWNTFPSFYLFTPFFPCHADEISLTKKTVGVYNVLDMSVSLLTCWALVCYSRYWLKIPDDYWPRGKTCSLAVNVWRNQPSRSFSRERDGYRSVDSLTRASGDKNTICHSARPLCLYILRPTASCNMQLPLNPAPQGRPAVWLCCHRRSILNCQPSSTTINEAGAAINQPQSIGPRSLRHQQQPKITTSLVSPCLNTRQSKYEMYLYRSIGG